MGTERAVTRWYVKRGEIQRTIDTLQARLEQPQSERTEIEHQLAEARRVLLALGPCPKPMMG